MIPATDNVSNFIFLEHVNLASPDPSLVAQFYNEVLGFPVDTEKNPIKGSETIWINVGPLTQIHLPKYHISQRIDGHLVFSHNNPPSDQREYVDPLGNKIVIVEGPSLKLLGVVVNVTESVLPAILDFYRTHFSTNISSDGLLRIGADQFIRYNVIEREPLPYTDWHVAVYISRFSPTYESLSQHNLIFSQHRFKDKCATLQEAEDGHQFRCRDVVDGNGELVYQLEHEVRSLAHPSLRRAF